MQFESSLRPACSSFCQRDAVQSAMASQDVVNVRNEDESQDQVLEDERLQHAKHTIVILVFPL